MVHLDIDGGRVSLGFSTDGKGDVQLTVADNSSRSVVVMVLNQVEQLSIAKAMDLVSYAAMPETYTK